MSRTLQKSHTFPLHSGHGDAVAYHAHILPRKIGAAQHLQIDFVNAAGQRLSPATHPYRVRPTQADLDALNATPPLPPETLAAWVSRVVAPLVTPAQLSAVEAVASTQGETFAAVKAVLGPMLAAAQLAKLPPPFVESPKAWADRAAAPFVLAKYGVA